MKWLLDHLQSLMPGVLRVKDGHGFALGHTATLPTCEARRRGEKRRVQGGAGVLDREVVCRKTAADAYGWWDELLGISVLTGSTTWDPPSIGHGNYLNIDVTVTGAAPTDECVASFSAVTADRWLSSCMVTAADTCHVELGNRTGVTVNLGSGTVRCRVFKEP